MPAALKPKLVASASTDELATARWLLDHTPRQRYALRARIARKDPAIPEAYRAHLTRALNLIREVRPPKREFKPKPMPFGISRVRMVRSAGAPGLGRRR